MEKGMQNQKAAVDSGYWQLYRYNPDLIKDGKNPFKLESKGLKMPFKEYAYMETRYKMLTKSHPERAAKLIKEAQADVVEKWQEYERLVDVYEPNTKEEDVKKENEKLDKVTED
jgi:pyruvate-ferredoxin/flavodoxin oxidoreductase